MKLQQKQAVRQGKAPGRTVALEGQEYRQPLQAMADELYSRAAGYYRNGAIREGNQSLMLSEFLSSVVTDYFGEQPRG